MKIIFIIFFFSSVIYSQTFWGVDIQDREQFFKWDKTNKFNSEYYCKKSSYPFQVIAYTDSLLQFTNRIPLYKTYSDILKEAINILGNSYITQIDSSDFTKKYCEGFSPEKLIMLGEMSLRHLWSTENNLFMIVYDKDGLAFWVRYK